MKSNNFVGEILLLATPFMALPARAGTYSDELGRCLVAKSSDTDKQTLIQWLFASISAHPAVRSMAKVTEAERSEQSRRFAALTTRLLVTDCRTEATSALKYEGVSSIEVSFGLLGQIAMRSLMGDPAVRVQMDQIGTLVDTPELRALVKAAGLEPSVPAKHK